MANTDSTTTELDSIVHKNMPNVEQVECALHDIGHMAAKIGWTAALVLILKIPIAG